MTPERKLKLRTKIGAVLIIVLLILISAVNATININDSTMTSTTNDFKINFTDKWIKITNITGNITGRVNATELTVPLTKPTSPVTGDFYYTSSNNTIWMYESGAWISVGSSGVGYKSTFGDTWNTTKTNLYGFGHNWNQTTTSYNSSKSFWAGWNASNNTYIRNSNGKSWSATGANLQLAINDLTTGGTVYLPSGTITLTTNLSLKDDITIQGCGDSSIFYSTSNHFLDGHNVNNVSLKDFKLTGKTYILIVSDVNSSNINCENINADVTTTSAGVFYFYVNDIIMSNIRLFNCNVLNSSTFGFMFSGEGTMDTFDNVLIDSCSASNCGRYTGRYNDWVTGFDLSEGNTYVKNMTVINCKAEYSWESGFHLEISPLKYGVLITNCISNNNGIKSNPTFGSGFIVSGGVKLLNCYSSYNKNDGINIANYHGSDTIIKNCIDYKSYNGMKIHDSKVSGHYIYINDFTAIQSLNYGVYVLNSINIIAENLFVYNANGNLSTGFLNYFGTTLYPMENSSIEIYATEHNGGCNYVVFSQNGRNNTFSGKIITSKSGLYLYNCKDTTIKDLVVDAYGTYGVILEDSINSVICDTLIKNSNYSYDTLNYGIYCDDALYPIVDFNSIIIEPNGIITPFHNCTGLNCFTTSPSYPIEGMHYYNVTTHMEYCYNGTGWKALWS